LKSICSYKADLTKDGAAAKCNSFGMKLANPDDDPESLSILIKRANAEFDDLSSSEVWIGGEENGQCLILKALTPTNHVKKYIPCSSGRWSYCQFDSKYC
jgi:hypothetical protein